MKKKFNLKIFFSSFLILIPLSSISCSNINYVSQNNSSNNNEEEIILNMPDYFEKYDAKIYKNRNKIKEKIISIINQYRLKEWNEYYQNKGLSNVLTINLNDYDQKAIGADEIKNWELIDGSFGFIATKKYLNQDFQFRYINDFINLENNTENKNKEDFLYLRWLYFSIFGANLYQRKVSFLPPEKNVIKESKKDKAINEVNLNDWISSISKCVIEANPRDLLEIIYTFFVYYGLVPDFEKIKDYFSNLTDQLKKPGDIINQMKKILINYGDKLENELGGDFIDEFKKLYEEIKKEYLKVHNKTLTFKEFLKDFKKITNEFKDVSKKFQETITKWQNLSIREEIQELLINLMDALPKIEAPDFFEDWKLFGLQYSILHAQLCAKDMLMRLLSKNDESDLNYKKIWEAKKIRAIEIYKKMFKYSCLFINSFSIFNGEDVNQKIKDELKKRIDIFLPNNDFISKQFKKILIKMIDVTLLKLVQYILDSVKNVINNLLVQITKETNLVYVKTKDYYF